MIEFIKSPDHVLALRLQGEITKADIAQVKDAMEHKLAAHSSIGMAVDFSQFNDATAEAIREDIRFEMDLFGQIARFPRISIVTDKQWLGALMGYAGQLLPSLELQMFAPGKLDQAVAWSGQLPRLAPTADKPAVSRIVTDRDDVFAFEIDGIMEPEAVEAVISELKHDLETHDKLRVLVRMGRFGFDPSILKVPHLFSTKLAATRKVERYAMVGAPAWMGGMVKMFSPLMSDMDMRVFSKDDEADAWTWLEAKPRS